MDDLISRQAAIEAFQMFRKYDSNRTNSEWVDRIEVVLRNLPTFDTDISEYLDRLWKLAYERGQKEGVIRCKDCQWWDADYRECGSPNWYPDQEGYVLQPAGMFCGWAERRNDG